MSDVSEEQAMELEALQSIYQDDMTGLSSPWPCALCCCLPRT